MMASEQSPAASDIPSFLRFLTQDAKIPLAKAILCVKNLQAASFSSPAAIANAKIETLTPLVLSADDAKRVLNAAKRTTKRGSSSDSTSETASRGKKRKLSPTSDEPTPGELESSLALPEPVTEYDAIRAAVLHTNRAPLLLAFAVVLLEYTMPSQPLSSRLSLAQAMVSAGAREKAVHLGIESGKSAEDEGYGMGQPVVRVMGKEVRVLKRWGYEWSSDTPEILQTQETQSSLQADNSEEQKLENSEGQEYKDVKIEDEQNKPEQQPALWGLDLEALKKSNSSAASTSTAHQRSGPHAIGLPIYTPQSARSYLLKSFASAQDTDKADRKGAKAAIEAKERNLGLLLGSLKVLYQSWIDTLDADELNRRAWSWYVACRPNVEHGVAGWGGKGEVRLAKILSLRKQ